MKIKVNCGGDTYSGTGGFDCWSLGYFQVCIRIMVLKVINKMEVKNNKYDIRNQQVGFAMFISSFEF